MVFGNERNYVVALITLDPDALARLGRRERRERRLRRDREVRRLPRRWSPGYVDELNKNLNRWETIKKWELLDHDLTVESGELTPSMKVKRNVVEDNYKDVIDGLLRLTLVEESRSDRHETSRLTRS